MSHIRVKDVQSLKANPEFQHGFKHVSSFKTKDDQEAYILGAIASMYHGNTDLESLRDSRELIWEFEEFVGEAYRMRLDN